jgi:hypothetical protein
MSLRPGLLWLTLNLALLFSVAKLYFFTILYTPKDVLPYPTLTTTDLANVGASMSCNLTGLHRLLQGYGSVGIATGYGLHDEG